MAALRIFARSVITTTRQPQEIGNVFKCAISPVTAQLNKRWGSFQTSSIFDENTKYTDYEISKDPNEWIYVERALKPKLIPEPPKSTSSEQKFPSGWKPMSDEAKKLPYFVQRSRNHMQSVYLHRKNRGIRRITVVKRVEGNIVALEADLRKHLETVLGKKVGSQINEPTGTVKFRGDYVSRVHEWLESKGF